MTNPNATNKTVVRDKHRLAAQSLLDSLSGPFRRSAMSNALYPLTSPRSYPAADRLAGGVMAEMAKAGRIQRHGHLHWVTVSIERTLRGGRKVPELADTVTLKLKTHCPRKWLSVDLETGDVWAGDAKGWRRATEAERKEGLACLA